MRATLQRPPPRCMQGKQDRMQPMRGPGLSTTEPTEQVEMAVKFDLSSNCRNPFDVFGGSLAPAYAKWVLALHMGDDAEDGGNDEANAAQRARANKASDFLRCKPPFTHTAADVRLAVLALLCKYARRDVPTAGSNAWRTLDKVLKQPNEQLRAFMQAHYEQVPVKDAPMKGSDLLKRLREAGVVAYRDFCQGLREQLQVLGYEVRDQVNRSEIGHFRFPVWVREKTA